MNIYFLHFFYYSFSFILFLFFTWQLSRSNNHQLFINNKPVTSPLQWILLQVSGIILFGLVLPINKTISIHSVLFNIEKISSIQLALFIVCIFLIIIVSFLNYRNKTEVIIKHAVNYIYQKLYFVILYFFVRSLFIITYEIWFRGYLLFESIKVFGTTSAVIINVILYFIIHIFNERKILVGTVIFGLILCLFTIWFNSVWPAIIMHLVLTLSAEGFVLINLYKKLKTTT